MIEAELADGRILEFPDGTAPEVVQKTVKNVLSLEGQQQAQVAPQQFIQEQVAQEKPFEQMSKAEKIDRLRQRSQPSQRTVGNTLLGIPEAAATMATGASAAILSGLTGIAALAQTGDEQHAGKRIKEVREAFTFKPISKAGKDTLRGVGEVLSSTGELLESSKKALGDTTFEATGSPVLATMAASFPEFTLELLGAKTGGLFKASGRGAFKNTANRIKAVKKTKEVAKAVEEAAPTVDQLFDTAKGIYKEIDDAGVIVKKEAFEKMTDRIERGAKKSGLDRDNTPKAARAVERFKELKGQDVNLAEVDTLRKVARSAADTLDPTEQSLGIRIIEEVDSFLKEAGPEALNFPKKGTESLKVGQKYKLAQNLWGRARKSELVSEMFEVAGDQASGFENGLRTQFRGLLRNKRKRAFFNKEEIASMRQFVRGDGKTNLAKLIGKFGIAEGGAINIIRPTIGVAAGGKLAGIPGMVAIPVVGQISKNLAQRMTSKQANFLDQVIRAGKDANKITAAYLKNTPKAQRSASELSELLMRTDIDIDKLSAVPLAQEAKQIVTQNRASLAGTLAPTAIKTTEEE